MSSLCGGDRTQLVTLCDRTEVVTGKVFCCERLNPQLIRFMEQIKKNSHVALSQEVDVL